jgi:hypothetical protein
LGGAPLVNLNTRRMRSLLQTSVCAGAHALKKKHVTWFLALLLGAGIWPVVREARWHIGDKGSILGRDGLYPC